ncbi:MAG: 1,4-alpha-glucan branching protein GlgB [Oscillospiraceae bacterium]
MEHMKDLNREELLWRFHEGTETYAYRFFGAHPEQGEDGPCWRFRVWAPQAQAVALVGPFNGWDETACPLENAGSEVWECVVPGLREPEEYKYVITARDGRKLWKADPYAFYASLRPETNSRLYDPEGYAWGDGKWLRSRRMRDWRQRPLNIYEVHLGSWRRKEDGSFYDYRELGDELADYVSEMGYDYVELLPVTEHPLDASWGYQCTGYFAPTSRWGEPKDFKYFVDKLHQKGIGVLLDWVPSHFCKDAQGLMEFDGSCCYEYADPLKQEHSGWGTRSFDFGRGEVRSFLFSSACYWIREYHIDGLRVDAVASMLYLDYGRQGGEWRPNRFGGRENLEAIDFLQTLNRTVLGLDKGLLMVAEESTAWPHVTGDAEDGLGFSLKWNMGWMNDMCHYLKMDPFFRQHHHRDVTFSLMYAFSEQFLLPMSHDEVVHMKGSLRGKMPGDDWKQLAGVRGFYAYMMAHPGKKLSIMGTELGQWHEWNAEGQLDWYLLGNDAESREHLFFREMHEFYHASPELYQQDFSWEGFQWLVADDNHNNIVVFLRRDKKGHELLCAVNFSPEPQEDYRFGVPPKKQWQEVFNTDDVRYGGSGVLNASPVLTERVPSHNLEQSISLRIPPLGAVFLRGSGRFNTGKRTETERKDSK